MSTFARFAELAENAKHPHMHGFRRQAILGVALPPRGRGGGVSPHIKRREPLQARLRV